LISNKFIKSSFIYSVIGALPLASSVILLPFYTNYLTTEQFGLLALYIAFTGIIQIIANFGLDNFIGISYIDLKNDKKALKDIISTILSLLIFIGIFVLLILSLAGNTVFVYYSSLTIHQTTILFYPWGLFCVITGIFNGIFRTYINLLIFQERSTRFFWMNILNFTLTIGISLIILFNKPYSLEGPIYGRLLSGIGIFILAVYFFIKEFGISFKSKLLKEIILYCYPVLTYAILIWIVGNIDKYIFAAYLPTFDLALFDFAVKCTLFIEFLHNGLTASIYPKVLKIWKDLNIKHSTQEVNKYFNSISAIVIVLLPFFQ